MFKPVIKSACDMVKKSVILSLFFFIIGAILEVVAQLLTLDNSIPVFFAYAGIFSILIGIIGILITFIAIMIPKINRHLQACQH